MSTGVPSIIDYTSYRQFLRDVVTAERAQRPAATLQRIARLFDLTGPALSMVLDGSRNLAPHRVYRIARLLKMSREEIAYFEALVLSEQARDPEERDYHLSKLQELRNQKKTQTIRMTPSVLLSEWFIPAMLVYLLEVAPVDAAQVTPAHLATTFGLAEDHVARLLERLATTGILRVKPEGKVELRVDELATTVVQKNYLKSLLDETRRRIDPEYASPHSFFAADTLALPLSQVRSLILEYKALVEKYIACAAPREELSVIQTAFQLFPIVRRGS